MNVYTTLAADLLISDANLFFIRREKTFFLTLCANLTLRMSVMRCSLVNF